VSGRRARPGIADCSADDDLGNTVANGGLIETTIPGAHARTVTATSDDGQVSSDTVDYTVLPNDTFTLSHVTGSSNGSVGFAIRVPGPGKIAALVTAPTGSAASVKLAPA
jgi:hypothetical protein